MKNRSPSVRIQNGDISFGTRKPVASRVSHVICLLSSMLLIRGWSVHYRVICRWLRAANWRMVQIQWLCRHLTDAGCTPSSTVLSHSLSLSLCQWTVFILKKRSCVCVMKPPLSLSVCVCVYIYIYIYMGGGNVRARERGTIATSIKQCD